MDLDVFEGIAGYRWSAFLSRDELVHFCSSAPAVPTKKLAMIARILARAPLEMEKANISFEKGVVLVRRGDYGVLVLFCEKDINTSMIDIVLSETLDKSTEVVDDTLSGSVGNTVSSIQSIDLDGSSKAPKAVVDELLALYTRYLGPLAQKLAAREARNAGISLDPLSTRHWSKLLNLMAARISVDKKRDDFLSEAVLLKNKF